MSFFFCQAEDGIRDLVRSRGLGDVYKRQSYDPTFGYEVAVIVQDGLRRMVQEQEDVFYYLTLLNENYAHPAMPEGVEKDILKGMYRFRKGPAGNGPRVQLLGSGAILREVMAGAELLKQDWGVEADIWSCPSFTELARDGNAVAPVSYTHLTLPPIDLV